MTRKHLLFSQDLDIPIAFFEKFDADAIKEKIVEHLSEHKDDTLEHCKEYGKEDIKKYYGTEIINFYRNNNNNEPCKVITKSNKEYLKKLC